MARIIHSINVCVHVRMSKSKEDMRRLLKQPSDLPVTLPLFQNHHRVVEILKITCIIMYHSLTMVKGVYVVSYNINWLKNQL